MCAIQCAARCGMMAAMRKKRLSVMDALGQDKADRRIAILREIDKGGSISQAARTVGVSYKAAWQALATLTNLAGVALVGRAVGGVGGGGTQLTDAGRELLQAADALVRVRAQVAADVASGGAAHAAAAQLAIRTSMRNQWPSVVTGLRRDGNLVDVLLAARSHGALPALARVTRESAQLLGLASGVQVQVLCKATAVRVLPQAQRPDAAPPNCWSGRVQRVARGASGDEVVLQLEGGLQLVGFAPPQSSLRARAAAFACAEPSALALLVPDH